MNSIIGVSQDCLSDTASQKYIQFSALHFGSFFKDRNILLTVFIAFISYAKRLIFIHFTLLPFGFIVVLSGLKRNCFRVFKWVWSFFCQETKQKYRKSNMFPKTVNWYHCGFKHMDHIDLKYEKVYSCHYPAKVCIHTQIPRSVLFYFCIIECARAVKHIGAYFLRNIYFQCLAHSSGQSYYCHFKSGWSCQVQLWHMHM